jgi:hypothetical protein
MVADCEGKGVKVARMGVDVSLSVGVKVAAIVGEDDKVANGVGDWHAVRKRNKRVARKTTRFMGIFYLCS